MTESQDDRALRISEAAQAMAEACAAQIVREEERDEKMREFYERQHMLALALQAAAESALNNGVTAQELPAIAETVERAGRIFDAVREWA